jgi:hypothetical protein
LQKLYLEPGDIRSAETLIHLLGYPLLEVLHVDGWLAADDELQQRFTGGGPVTYPFPSIKDISLRGEASTVKILLCNTPKTLVSLNLDVFDNSDSILPTISRLSNLVHLKLVFDGDRGFSRADFDYVSRLPKLQKCHLEWGHVEEGPGIYPDCPWLTDECFNTWISKLPQLRELFLGLESPTITQRSLQFLADSCPLLLACALLWEHDLETWPSLKASMFPNLQILLLGKVKDRGRQESQGTTHADASKDVKVIRSLAPNLEDFFIGQRGSGLQLPHERALVAAFEAGV